MEALLELLRQRRIWVAVIGVLVMGTGAVEVDPDTTADLIVASVDAGGKAAMAVLALWSYVKPKLAVK